MVPYYNTNGILGNTIDLSWVDLLEEEAKYVNSHESEQYGANLVKQDRLIDKIKQSVSGQICEWEML